MKTLGVYKMSTKRINLFLIVAGLALFANFGLAQTKEDTVQASTGIRIVPKVKRPNGTPTFKASQLSGYLMVYFKDQSQSAYLAVSTDGYTFTDINGGRPVFVGSQLAEQKGVRDPHITRGSDGAFYLALTDLHIFGKRAGYRNTEWERPEEKYGWGNNRAIVMMKSYDLVHWTHADFRVDQAFPQLGDIDCAWAPETIYDPIKKKMMVYFTIRYNNKDANIYYSYANDDFTRLETIPQQVTNIGGIDADITKVNNKYQMFYVSKARILHAASDKINTGFVAEDKRIDPETVNTEAPNVFKRLGTNKWVLMYDVYGARPNNMGFSETTDFISFTNLNHFNEGVMKTTNFSGPKHGAVTYLTHDELKAIARHWKININLN
jgi:hypothetical protein